MITFNRRLDRLEKRIKTMETQKSTVETANEIDAYFEDVRKTKETLPSDERQLREKISAEADKIINDEIKRSRIEDSLTAMICYLRHKSLIEERLLHEHGLKTVDEIIAEGYEA